MDPAILSTAILAAMLMVHIHDPIRCFFDREDIGNYERRNQGLEYAYPIVVGDNVWFGAGVQVMPGVTIGSNVVIGSGSIVTKDIPSNSVAVGNPCKVIRKITDEDKKKSWDR